MRLEVLDSASNQFVVCVLLDGCVQAASDRPIQGVKEGTIIAEEKFGWPHRNHRERGGQA